MTDEIGLFPLSIVLLPTERMPLHVFEPRYLELIEECLRDGVEFGLVLETDEGLAPVGTRTAVTDLLERLPDGRLNVLVEGRARFRLVEETGGRSFRTAQVEDYDDEPEEPASPEEVEAALTAYRRLVQLTASNVDEPPARAEQISFELAARVDFGNELEQELLEIRSARERLERVHELLTLAADAVEREVEIHKLASGNGKVVPLRPDDEA